MTITRDPVTGDGQSVTPDGHAKVAARTEDLSEAETLDGWGFLASSGVITLGNAATENAIAFIKNTSESSTYIVTKMELHLGNSTSGTGDGTVKIYRNPTTGTIIDDASAMTVSNRNTGKSNTLTGQFYKPSAAGKTITNGGTYDEYPVATPKDLWTLESESIVLEPNGSLAVSYTTQTSNSAQNVSISIEIHRLTLGV